MMLTDSEIYERVKQIVVEALGVEEEEVTPEARLTDDLGAESIDYLDIFFRIEQAFHIKVEAGDKVVTAIATDERFVKEGTITDDGMEELRRRLPEVRIERLEPKRDIGSFLSIFDVTALVEMVKARLAAKEEVAEHAG